MVCSVIATLPATSPAAARTNSRPGARTSGGVSRASTSMVCAFLMCFVAYLRKRSNVDGTGSKPSTTPPAFAPGTDKSPPLFASMSIVTASLHV